MTANQTRTVTNALAGQLTKRRAPNRPSTFGTVLSMGDTEVESRPTLLCVAPFVPWSGIDHAGGSYLYHYLTEFSRLGWLVQLASPRTPDNELAQEHLAASDPAVKVSLFGVPERSKLATRLAMLLTGRDGVSPSRWQGTEDLARMVRTADVVDLQWHDIYGYASWFAKSAPHTPLVALAHDLRSQSVTRNAQMARGAKRLSLGFAIRRVRARERRELAHCARLLAFKSSDLSTARRQGVTTPGFVAPPYVDLQHGGVSPDPSSRTMVFPAAFYRSENSEAAHWFLDAIWPLVREAVPDARVCFAGARPPEDLVARASEDVIFTGYLPTFLDGYRGALLSIAPLLRGAGLKFKVVQSIALGFPVVGTSVAMEGIEDFLPEATPQHFDREESFAGRIVEILVDPDTALMQGRAHAALLRRQLTFPDAMSALSREYISLTGRTNEEEVQS